MGALDAVLKALLPATRAIDAVTTWIGKRVAWLILVAVPVSAVNATVRKVFDTSSNVGPELQCVLFSAVFLLCSPWTLLANEHIRIDILNNLLPQRVRNIIDVVGHAFFLLPPATIMVVTGWPFFTTRPIPSTNSPRTRAGCRNGLPNRSSCLASASGSLSCLASFRILTNARKAPSSSRPRK